MLAGVPYLLNDKKEGNELVKNKNHLETPKYEPIVKPVFQEKPLDVQLAKKENGFPQRLNQFGG